MRIGYEVDESAEPCAGDHGPEANCESCLNKAAAKARAHRRATAMQDGDPDAARDIAREQESI